jgi:hypothetical protein
MRVIVTLHKKAQDSGVPSDVSFHRDLGTVPVKTVDADWEGDRSFADHIEQHLNDPEVVSITITKADPA